MDADIWIENIPYGETRTYVQRIFEHIVAFAWVRDAEPMRLMALLPPVEPELASAVPPPLFTHLLRGGASRIVRSNRAINFIRSWQPGQGKPFVGQSALGV
jgi:hypothetical protein